MTKLTVALRSFANVPKTLYRECCLSDRSLEVCSIQFVPKYGFYLKNTGDDYWIHTWGF